MITYARIYSDFHRECSKEGIIENIGTMLGSEILVILSKADPNFAGILIIFMI